MSPAERDACESDFVEGYKEGYVEGVMETIVSVAKNMRAKNFDVTLISEVTGLGVDELDNLLKD